MYELNATHFPPDIVDWFKNYPEASKVNRQTFESFLKGPYSQDNQEKSFAWILGKSDLPWMPLDIEFPYEKMLEEARAVRGRFVSHRSGVEGGGYKDGNRGWEALALHGITAEKTQSYGIYGYNSEREVPYQWTDVSKLCPVTTQFFKKSYPCKTYYRVRYTIMKPGGFIFPHVDRAEKALWEVNLALHNPEGFYFKLEDSGYIPFKNGRAFILDVSKKHAVINMSNEERIHMIVHGFPLREPQYQSMIEKSFQKTLKNPESFWKM